MKTSKKLAAIATLAISTLVGASAFAAPSPQSQGDWRNGRNDRGGYTQQRDSRYDQSYLSGIVQRIDRRNGIVEIRDRNRTYTVSMVRRNSRRGADLSDLHRGDYVTFAGDWTRGRVFEAWRIDSVDSGRGRGRGRR
jgi:hypothetical protein